MSRDIDDTARHRLPYARRQFIAQKVCYVHAASVDPDYKRLRKIRVPPSNFGRNSFDCPSNIRRGE